MRLANPVWTPRATRRTLERAARLAASVLIAAAVAETSGSSPAKAGVIGWTPGNPGLVGSYTGSAISDGGVLLDINGDGFADYRLLAFSNGYGGDFTFYLEPLTVDGVDNQIFAQGAPAQSHTGEVSCTPASRFANKDDILTATGPTDTPPCQAALYGFGEGGYVGLIFHIPSSVVPSRTHQAGGSDDFGYLNISTDPGTLKIGGVGIQPYLPATPVHPTTWGKLKTLYR